MADLVLDLVEGELEIHSRSIARPFFRQHRADLGQGEAELLALEDDGETLAIPGIVDARVPSRRGDRRPRSS
jgi:hypothetical protein